MSLRAVRAPAWWLKMRQKVFVSAAELRENLTSEQARATRLEQLLRCAEAEILALRAARDAAIRIAAWGGPRRIESGTRDEH